jgi:HK97 family phage prohead protease
MEHMTLKAATTAKEQGIFTAVISAASVDREKDVVEPAGMVAALHKWTETGKQIPLAWNHSSAADQIVGSINPASAKDVGGEVVVAGQIDMSTETGAHVWRLIKAGVVGFSFGYLIPDGGATPRKGGGRHITALDVFEITATATPMHNDTRVLDYKADVKQADAAPTAEQKRMLHSMIGQAKEYIASKPDSEDAAEMTDVLETLEDLIGEPEDSGDGEPEDSGDGEEEKAVWSTAYMNDLPDSAFLYIAPGGSKDSEGKTTPRSLRYFPVRDANGAVDQVHVRNALSRIPQSNLSQSIKDSATAKATRLLDSSKTVDATDKEPSARSVDPLRRQANAKVLEVLSKGADLSSAPRKPAPPPEPAIEPERLRAQARAEMLSVLSGIEDTNE